MSDQPSKSFFLSFKGNAPDFARDAKGAVEGLTSAIEASEAEIKKMSADLRRLKGSSDEVKAAKDKLKAAIGLERQEITRNTLELKKHGATTTDVAEKQKKLAAAEKSAADASKKASEQKKKSSDALKSTLGAIGGPASKATGAVDELSTAVEALGAEGAAASIAVTAAAAAIVAVGGAAVYGAGKLVSFIVESQAAAREMNLLRTAAGGAEVNGINMGTQVDALAKKVPVLKGEINKTAIELERFGLRGQTIVDTMAAIEQAAGVGDEALASFSKEVVERGKQFNRFSLNPQELLGKNLRFDDVAAELAKGMHIGIDEARQALVSGQVPLEAGAAALRSAVERKFAGVNKALMLDPGHQVEKFGENLKELTSGVNIEPLLHDMHDFFDLFDSEKTQSGAAIKQLVTSLGGDLVDGIHSVAPAASDLVRNLVLGALKVDNAWLQVKVTIKKAIEEATGGINNLKLSLTGLFDPIGTGRAIGQAVHKGHPSFNPAKFITDAVTGMAFGNGASQANAAGANLADATSKGFTDKAEIHSPSRLFQRHTENIIRGIVDPLKSGEGSVLDALNVTMAPMMKLGGRASSSSSTTSSSQSQSELHVHLHVDSEKTARVLTTPSAQSQMKKLLVEVLLEAGMGVPA